MKNKVMGMVIGGVLVVGVLGTVSAYSTNIWSPIQFVKQLFVTPNGELDSSKATIKIDGTNGRIDAKSIYENGVQVATKSDLKSYATKSYVDSKVKGLASKSDLANVKIYLPTCQKGYVLTSTDGKNFKCVKDLGGSNNNCSMFGGFSIQKCIADGIAKTTDGYYVVDINIVYNGCNNGLVPDKSKCITKIGDFYVAPSSTQTDKKHPDAVSYCSNLTIAGDADWYLPSLDELQTIYNYKSKIYGLSSGRYWSSKHYTSDDWYAYWMSNIRELALSADHRYAVRCLSK